MKKNKDLLLVPDFDPYDKIIYCDPDDIDVYSAEDQRSCFYYDEDAGDHPVEFIEQVCSHVHGSMSKSPFLLQDWQKSIVRNLFGWKTSRAINGFNNGFPVEMHIRRFGTLFLYIPRKNGKSIFTAALICYVMFCDGEQGAQLFSAATSGDQSEIIFDVVKQMIQNDDSDDEECMKNLSKVLKTSVSLKEDPLTVFKALSGSTKSKHGLNCHFVGIDELHEHEDDKIIEPLITSMGARMQPIISVMTTADYNRSSPCNEMHQYAKDVRDGLKPDSSFLPVIYEAQKEDDWTDPVIWAKANPNLGISVSEEFLYKQCQLAQNLPSKQNSFKRLYLNIKTDSSSVWMPKELWDACEVKQYTEDQLIGAKCYIGIDIASKQDMVAISKFFPDFNLVIMKFWLPEARKLKYDEAGWARDGYIELTPGDVFDTEIAEDYIREEAKKYEIKSCCYDPWNASQLAMHLVEDGFDMVQFTQTARFFSAPLDMIENLTVSGKLDHQNDPVLAWMVQNCVIDEDNAEHKKLSKKKSANKIDGVVALAMAIGGFIADEGDKESVYEKQGITFL